MAKFSVEIKCRLTRGQNNKLTVEEVGLRQAAVDRLVEELAASEIAEPEMVARVRTGRVEIVGVMEGKTRAEVLDKVLKWEMAMENVLDVDMTAEVEEKLGVEVVRIDGKS